MNIKSISFIIPFYEGNTYLPRLFESIQKVVDATKDIAIYEILLVNDSPWVDINLPDNFLNIKIIKNEKNLGIQKSRINGLMNSTGDYVVFLDQDDEVYEDGFKNQVLLSSSCDVVVGNGIYELGEVNKKIFNNKSVMDYLIRKNTFINIRNVIPSPGECLIKKSVIPDAWINYPLSINGADDWFLWILLFENNCVFLCNPEYVYKHNDTAGHNLSSDLNKMKDSSIEMLNTISINKMLNEKNCLRLNDSINFKFLQDTRQLTFFSIIRYWKTIINNIIYKLSVYYYGGLK